MKPLLVIGSYLSPYVRKVLVCLEVKRHRLRDRPHGAVFGDDRFSKLSRCAASRC